MQNHCPINQRPNLIDETSQQESRQDHSSAGINNILDVLENGAWANLQQSLNGKSLISIKWKSRGPPASPLPRVTYLIVDAFFC